MGEIPFQGHNSDQGIRPEKKEEEEEENEEKKQPNERPCVFEISIPQRLSF